MLVTSFLFPRDYSGYALDCSMSGRWGGQVFVLLFPANRMYNQTMSLTSDDLADIKQLMTSLLDAQERRLDKRFDEQDERLDEILNAVGGELNEQDKMVSDHTEQIQNHEKRILRLEKRIA